ncbi:putative Mss4-like protein [Seiridium cardinale]
MGDVSPEDGNWVISTSLFVDNEPVYQIKSHVYTDSCRLTSGAHVISWTFIPLDRCEPKIERDDLLIGTMKTFESLPGVLISFCGVCGADVFYSCQERTNIVDVAVDILRAPEGVRAENWPVWRAGHLGWVKDGLR